MINNGGVHHRQETESGGCVSRYIVVFKPIVRPYYSPHEISLTNGRTQPMRAVA